MSKKKLDFLDIVFGLALLSVIAVITIYWLNFRDYPISVNVEDWGVLGDYFGGLLNPILGFVSVIGVLWTIRESQKSHSFQKFENLFTHLLSQLSPLIDQLYNEKIHQLEEQLFKSYKLNKEIREEVIENREFSAFFIYLYQVLKHIDTSLENEYTKKKYANIVRSLIPNRILQLLLLNCYLDTEEHNFNKYKELIEKFSFFEHISLYDRESVLKTSILLSISTYYNKNAFGGNLKYKDFKESMLFRIFPLENNFVDIMFNIVEKKLEIGVTDKYKNHSFIFHTQEASVEMYFLYSEELRKYTIIKTFKDELRGIYLKQDGIILYSDYYPRGLSLLLDVDDKNNIIFKNMKITQKQ